MEFLEYQQHSWTTALNTAKNPTYLLGGLAGEAGEVCGEIAKSVRDNRDVNIVKLCKELGDVLWFVSAIATYYNISLREIAVGNVVKLADRKERGVLGGDGDDR